MNMKTIFKTRRMNKDLIKDVFDKIDDISVEAEFLIEAFLKSKLDDKDKKWLLRFKKYEEILDNIDPFEWEWNKGKEDRDKFRKEIEDIKNNLNK